MGNARRAAVVPSFCTQSSLERGVFDLGSGGLWSWTCGEKGWRVGTRKRVQPTTKAIPLDLEPSKPLSASLLSSRPWTVMKARASSRSPLTRTATSRRSAQRSSRISATSPRPCKPYCMLITEVSKELRKLKSVMWLNELKQG